MSRYCLAAPRVRTLTGLSATRSTARSTDSNKEHIDSTDTGPEGLSALSAKDLTRATIRRAGILTKEDSLVPLPTNVW
ncbi:hypothetical protein FN846DRAFT_903985 [Sphaerosporella brunnea]|uniref:Uncharacterized protein n=1 Tax=Sphaerosporella brunnea TaxID=1250544 RepID=A0A5J5F617_9PEZI|nr:hypothetical protein FN846DRAFT_903985 [Sphaerosporella brunnea]